MRRRAKIKKAKEAVCLLLMTAVFLANLMIPAEAFGAEEAESSYIYDEAGLLTQEQAQNLEEQAFRISEECQCGVYFMAVEDFKNESQSFDVQTAAEDRYLLEEFGWGEGKDGVLLFLSMEERDYALISYGNWGNEVFTDYGKEMMSENFLDNFAQDDWYGGCLDYVDDCASLLRGQVFDSSYDSSYDPFMEGWKEEREVEGGYSNASFGILMAVFPSAAFALLVCVALSRQMKTARKQKTAFEYIADDKVDFRIRDDIFTHTTQTRRRIQSGKERNNSGDMGHMTGGMGHMIGGMNHMTGGSSHSSGSGFSGQSGKF